MTTMTVQQAAAELGLEHSQVVKLAWNSYLIFNGDGMLLSASVAELKLLPEWRIQAMLYD